eukprot:tig00020560_g11083.t1
MKSDRYPMSASRRRRRRAREVRAPAPAAGPPGRPCPALLRTTLTGGRGGARRRYTEHSAHVGQRRPSRGARPLAPLDLRTPPHLAVLSFSLSQRFLFELLVSHSATSARCAHQAPIVCVVVLWPRRPLHWRRPREL